MKYTSVSFGLFLWKARQKLQEEQELFQANITDLVFGFISSVEPKLADSHIATPYCTLILTLSL